MSVQQLNPTYVQGLLKRESSAAAFQQMISEGKIVKKDGNYYVAGNDIQLFQPGHFVQDADGNVKTYQINAKGAYLERTTTQKEGQVVRETKETTYQFNQLIGIMKLPEEKQEEFKTFLKAEGINIDDAGQIKTDNNKAIQDAINKYVEQNKANFIKDGAEYIEFDSDSDPSGIAELEQPNAENTKPAITKQNGRYIVTNRDALNTALPDAKPIVIEDEPIGHRSGQLDGVTTTTTERKRADLKPEPDLKNNKDARKKLEAQARERYADFAGDASNRGSFIERDIDKRNAVDFYVAESKYEKKINKQEQEILKQIKSGKTVKDATAADVVEHYLDNYADQKTKDAFEQTIAQLFQSNNQEDKDMLLQAAKDLKIYNYKGDKKEDNDSTPTDYNSLDAQDKRAAALVLIASKSGIEPKDLLRLMAMNDVMGARTTAEIADDDAYFIKHQAKDYVRNQQAQQEFPKTVLTYDSIGKHGRKLVDKTHPLVFGDGVTEDEYNNAKDKTNYYEATYIDIDKQTGKKTQKTGHFKFNQDKWKTFMKVACDPYSANDADKRLLEDMNLTLQEGRTGLEMRLPDRDGSHSEIRKMIGNSNDATGNRELNRWRDLVEQTGLSVDSNPTAAKRLWHVVKNAGIGVGVGLLTGGIGSLFGATVAYAGQTAAQTIPYIASANPKVSFSFDTESKDFTKWVKTTDTVTTIVDGEEFTNKTTHNTPVTITAEGQTYNGQIINNPETGQPELWVNGEKYPGKVNVENTEVKGEVEAKGQDYEGDKNTRWQQMKNAGILGGIAGAARGVATMNKVDAKGRNTDDVYDFTYMEPDVKENETQFTLQIPQYSTVEKRSVDKEGGAVEEFKAKKWQGPAAYGIMYQYDDGTPVNPRDFAKAYQSKIGGAMSRGKFYAFPELEINGKKIVLRDDYAEQYKKVPEGTQGSVREVNYNNTAQRRHIAGTIRQGN